MWREAPALVLKNIFCYLEASDLLAVSLTCQLWHQVAKEDSVWKHLVQRLWKIKGNLPPGKVSWRNEFRRLTYETPTYLSETLHEHTDEVLDVSFSHDGKVFCTTSKDATVKIWELGYPTKVKHNAKMLLLAGWNLTQFSTFNKSDTYLCVCGVQIVGEYFPSPYGRGAVFRTSDFKLIQTMKMEPPQLFADWYDDTTVLGGYVEENETLLHIKAFKVVEKESCNIQEPDSGQIVYSFDTDHHHTMNLLVADLPYDYQSHDQSGDYRLTVHQIPKEAQSVKNGRTKEVKSAANNACSSEEHQKMMIFVCEQHSALAVHDVTNLHEKTMARNTKLNANTRQSPGSIRSLSSANNSIGIQKSSLRASKQGHKNQSEAQTVRGPRSVCELPGASILDKPTVSPSFDKYYISGMKLSPDHRELYFNHRICHFDKVDDDGYPVIESDIIVDKYDLVTKTHTKNLLKGHKASSKYPAWYICLDISQDYIISGSEDGRAFLWDRHYLSFLGHLPHSLNPDIVINGTTFCPTDDQCVVTGADDGIIHVWRSSRRHAELQRQQGLVAMDL